MAILRETNKERYTVVFPQIITDDRLSLKDLGLLIKLLSLPDNCKFSENGLLKIFKKDGQASLRTGLKNLESYGYLKRERIRDSKGQMASVEWTIIEDVEK